MATLGINIFKQFNTYLISILFTGHEMSTKRSRQVRSSKLIAPDEIQDLINSSDEDSKEKLTDEQSKINQKLSECGLLEEDLNWKEKQEIYSSITASVNTAEFEEKRRSR